MERKCGKLSLLFMKDSNDRAEVPVFPALPKHKEKILLL